jgi:4-alpha-glucanotransferase
MSSLLPKLIRFGREVCGDLAAAERREWWLANGRGAYAAGTVAGTLSRRYHGLLIAPVDPPLGRRLVFARADATLLDGDRTVPLFTNRWSGGAVDPAGFVHIESFRLDGRMPVWQYAVGDLVVEQRIWLEHGADTVCVAWRLVSAAAAARELRLRVTLFVNARDHHGSTRAGDFDFALEGAGPLLRARHAGFDLHLHAYGGAIKPARSWNEHFALEVERERGLHAEDTHLCVGEATLVLGEEEWCGIVGSLDPAPPPWLGESLRRCLARESRLLEAARGRSTASADAPEWIDQLVLAADSFVIARPVDGVPDGESVIAGYPWFGDWGRDTMIALPGLTLATGRHDSARRILLTFARFVDRGMLPNVFPGAGETADYNTVDAALWYFEAWRAYLDCADDRASLEQAFPVLESMIDWHVRGTRYGIGVDAADGLLRAGEPGVQITWMDAKLGDWVVTPRIGKPVEINALWFNALRTMAALARRLGRSTARYDELAARVAASFVRFRNPAGGLYDVIDGPGGNDATLRPNQILAVSLAHSPLGTHDAAEVTALVGRTLATSYGLRSLAPGHPDYRGRYEGGVWERDSSYHQGPVWGWLLGHYALAVLRVTGDPVRAQAILEPIRDHLFDAGLGTVSEIFDGDPPHRPRGCPAQAWSVACVLDAWATIERAKSDRKVTTETQRAQSSRRDSMGRDDPLPATSGRAAASA